MIERVEQRGFERMRVSERGKPGEYQQGFCRNLLSQVSGEIIDRRNAYGCRSHSIRQVMNFAGFQNANTD